MKRVLTAAFLLPLVLLLVFKASPFCFFFFLSLILLVGLYEFFDMLARGQQVCSPFFGLTLGWLLCLAFFLRNTDVVYFLVTLAPISILAGHLIRKDDLSEAVQECFNTLFGVFYVAWLFSHFLLLRGLESGKYYVFFVLLVIWLGDTGAYYGGRSLGRHKLAVSISPQKTIEGALAGLIGSLAGALVVRQYFLPSWGISDSLAAGLLLGGLGQVGDLGESFIKRGMGVKDSGGLLPGHGGILDRIDSLLFAAPAMYYYCRFFVLNL